MLFEYIRIEQLELSSTRFISNLQDRETVSVQYPMHFIYSYHLQCTMAGLYISVQSPAAPAAGDHSNASTARLSGESSSSLSDWYVLISLLPHSRTCLLLIEFKFFDTAPMCTDIFSRSISFNHVNSNAFSHRSLRFFPFESNSNGFTSAQIPWKCIIHHNRQF